MREGCWFNLPDGSTARELEVTIPVKGRIVIPATIALEMDQWRDLLLESMQKRGWTIHDTLAGMLRSCLSGYEGLARDALAGASSVRDDMLVMLRSIVFVLETVVGEHLNHHQKNERLRGVMAVLERHIHQLRQEAFTFHGDVWRRDRDLFRWDERERHLRERIQELEARLAAPQTSISQEMSQP